MKTEQTVNHFAKYAVGDRDERPWGSYVVTSLGTTDGGEEFCEKEITVQPGQILSLQSHEHRREIWTVKQGILTVILNDRRITLEPGKQISIPLGALHCMANVGVQPCIVHERQEGLCREEDIIRYVDAYGRTTQTTKSELIGDSVALYKAVSSEISDNSA